MYEYKLCMLIWYSSTRISVLDDEDVYGVKKGTGRYRFGLMRNNPNTDFWFQQKYLMEKLFCWNILNPVVFKLINQRLSREKEGGTVCQWVNGLPYLEHIVPDLAGLSWAVSLAICCTNENGRGHWFWTKGGQFPAARSLIDALVDWPDNIVGDLCVSCWDKKETIAVSCGSHSFSSEGAKLPRSKFHYEVLITFPCGPCSISPTNRQGLFFPITQHQGHFFQLDVRLDSKWLL